MIYGVTGNADKSGIENVLVELINIFEENKIKYYLNDNFKSFLPDNTNIHKLNSFINKIDILISLGGDGTFLNTVSKIGNHSVPILGVNLGRLGFLSEIVPSELRKFILNIEHKKYKIDNLCVLSAYTPDKKFISGINEIVIDKCNSTRIIEIEIFYNNERVLNFLADGVIVSTPTGSTGYSLSSGGPIITPYSKVLIITPICPHSLNFRPIIVPDDGKIFITAKSYEKIRITADGHTTKIFKSPVEITIHKSGHQVKTVKKMNKTYFQTLNNKLLWGADIRHKY